MRTLTVELGDRSYPIWVGAGALSQVADRGLISDKAVIVTDSQVAAQVLDRFLAAAALHEPRLFTFPAGEQHKTLDTVADLLTCLLEFRLSRDDHLIALGGGVVGDVTGFAAACYMRGINFVQIPTTLLAQVDSSVGGKTGVNHPLGKNMIGAFHQPIAVACDFDLLDTLAEREYLSGIAEIIKYGLIRDIDFFIWLEHNMSALRERDRDALEFAVARSCEIKAAIVAEDEKESGVRAHLNLGHTFAHALETAGDYFRWLHGEAVAIGMVLAAELSAANGDLDGATVQRISSLINAAGLPCLPPGDLDPDTLWALMSLDKKVQAGKRRFITLERIGSARVMEVTSKTMITNLFETARDRAPAHT